MYFYLLKQDRQRYNGTRTNKLSESFENTVFHVSYLLPTFFLGCFGGDPTAAYSWIYNNGVTDDTCSIYTAHNDDCSAINICKNCMPTQIFPVIKYKCWAVDQYYKVMVGCLSEVVVLWSSRQNRLLWGWTLDMLILLINIEKICIVTYH